MPSDTAQPDDTTSLELSDNVLDGEAVVLDPKDFIGCFMPQLKQWVEDRRNKQAGIKP